MSKTPSAQALAELLHSDMFPRADVVKILAHDDDWQPKQNLLAAVRAESQERFEKSVQGLLEALDWKALADSDPMRRMPGLELLSASHQRSHGGFESGCDHLAASDLVRLAKLADKPDASFAWLAFRAIELGDDKALAEARKRIRADARPDQLYETSSDAEGSVRLASIVSARFGATTEDKLRTIATYWGRAGLPAALAVAFARERGLAVPAVLTGLPVPALRVVFDVASRVSKEIAEDVLVAAAGQKYMFDSRASAFALPWDEMHEVNANQQRYLACRYGRTVWSAYTPLEASGLPVAWKGVRIAAKQLPDETKAKKELEKKLKEQATKLGGKAETFVPARAVADKAKAVFTVVNADSYADRLIELLAAGAPADQVADDDGWNALHRAVRGDHETVARLLTAGADPKKAIKAGSTALDLLDRSYEAGHLRSAEALAAAGCRCSERSAIEAAGYGLDRMAAILVKASGASPAKAIEAAKSKKNPRTLKALQAL